MLRFNNFILIFLVSSCANYVNNMHKEFDNYENRNSRSIQSNTAIEQIAEGDKRYDASDFKDSSDSNSLWVGNGRENFFSSGGVRKEKGDLVTINVYQNLKNKISNEISRLYPDQSASETQKEEKPNAQPTKNTEKIGDIQDKISVVVTKEVRENHLILTGRKQLIYNENRHLVEIQALVHRKDISTDDTLNSDKIIQSSIKVLR